MRHSIDDSANEELLTRVGQMTRSLHNSLRGLGLDKMLEKAAGDIPDARDRLTYVAEMSERAAQRVLNATEVAIPLQEFIDEQAKAISLEIDQLLSGPATVEQYQALLNKNLTFLKTTSAHSRESKAQLMEIMMAQDFQDLTGQVVKKITELSQNIEQQLVQLLVDYSPEQIKRPVQDGLLNGPQIKLNGQAEVMSDQEQVDDLLESLGF
jgi:chemotaxis protein CheZ